jgi:hypothetical protein
LRRITAVFPGVSVIGCPVQSNRSKDEADQSQEVKAGEEYKGIYRAGASPIINNQSSLINKKEPL